MATHRTTLPQVGSVRDGREATGGSIVGCRSNGVGTPRLSPPLARCAPASRSFDAVTLLCQLATMDGVAAAFSVTSSL